MDHRMVSRSDEPGAQMRAVADVLAKAILRSRARPEGAAGERVLARGVDGSPVAGGNRVRVAGSVEVSR